MLPNNESTTYQHSAHLTLFTSIHWHCNVVRYLINSCRQCLRFIILFKIHVHIVDIRMLYNISSTSLPFINCGYIIRFVTIAMYIKVSCFHRLLPWHDRWLIFVIAYFYHILYNESVRSENDKSVKFLPLFEIEHHHTLVLFQIKCILCYMRILRCNTSCWYTLNWIHIIYFTRILITFFSQWYLLIYWLWGWEQAYSSLRRKLWPKMKCV